LFVTGCVTAMIACQSQSRTEAPASSDPKFVAGLSQVCAVDSLSGAANEDDVLERERLREDYLAEHVKHPDLIYHRTLWRVQAPRERAASLRALAAEGGLPACRYADALEEEG
jgi:hypothetical protein